MSQKLTRAQFEAVSRLYVVENWHPANAFAVLGAMMKLPKREIAKLTDLPALVAAGIMDDSARLSQAMIDTYQLATETPDERTDQNKIRSQANSALGHYIELYKQRFGRSPMLGKVDYAKGVRALSNILNRSVPLADLLNCVNRYLDDDNPIVKRNGWKIEFLQTVVDGYLHQIAEDRKGTPDAQNTRVAGADPDRGGVRSDRGRPDHAGRRPSPITPADAGQYGESGIDSL